MVNILFFIYDSLLKLLLNIQFVCEFTILYHNQRAKNEEYSLSV